MSPSKDQTDVELGTGDAIRTSPEADQTGTSAASPQWAPAELRVATAGLRDEVGILKNDADNLHHRAQDFDLADRAALKTRLGHETLLRQLADERGMGWNDIATALGVSLSAVRKWRSGATCTPAHRSSLARLAALLDLAEEAMIEDPAGWLLTEVEHGYTTRYIDLVAAGRESLVLDCALLRKRGREALDEHNPDWRESTVRKFDIEVDEDGVRSLRRR